jgi:pilus assembly protein CpaB
MLAAVFGILSALLMFAFLNKSDSGSSSSAVDQAINAGTGAESVVVVATNILAGERITSAMLTTRTMPAAALLAGHATKTEDVVGKVATAPLFAGEQVIDAKVTSYAGPNSLAYKVPEGKRALSVMIPHEAWAAGGLIQPGDRVDIYGITTLTKTDPLTNTERPDIVAGIIAQGVEVLAVSQTLVRRVTNVDAQGNPIAGTGADVVGAPNGVPGDKVETYEKAISITLALTPEEAAKVAIIDAMEDTKGQYRIVARQKGDDAEVTGTTTWSLEEVFGPRKK